MIIQNILLKLVLFKKRLNYFNNGIELFKKIQSGKMKLEETKRQ